jgi:hypothetical protein
LGRGKKIWKGRRLTRVLERTVFKRGKSEIPESRIEMLESRRERELRREETEALREAAEDWEVVILY